MGEFVDATFSFPTVIFSFLLLVVIGYWVFVLLGGVDTDLLDSDADGEGLAGLFTGIGLGGVPVTVAVSLLVGLAWCASFIGSVLLDRAGFTASWRVATAVAVLLVALTVAWLGTRLLVKPARRLFGDLSGASRHDFVGLVCVVRTGRVTADFGQAEVTAADGSSAIVQVRYQPPSLPGAPGSSVSPEGATGPGTGPLRSGSRAVIYDYDATGEFFWISPLDLDSADPRSLH